MSEATAQKSDAAAERGNTNLDFGEVRTGDVLLMNRKCLAMKHPLAVGLCLLTKTENRFDHAAMLVKVDEEEAKQYPKTAAKSKGASPSGTYVLETNMNGVTLYAAEDRIRRSSSNEIAVLRVERHADTAGRAPKSRAAGSSGDIMAQVENIYDTPYQDDVWRIAPSVFSPPDKMDRIAAVNKMEALQTHIAALRATGERQAALREPLFDLIGQLETLYYTLADGYFPHLPRQPSGEPDWRGPHLWIDGSNGSDRMVCTELVGNLWQRAGWTKGYVPASSLRTFDFLDRDRFLFINGSARLGDMYPVKWNTSTARHWRSLEVPPRTKFSVAAAHSETAVEDAVQFLNEARKAHGWAPLEGLRDSRVRSGPLVPRQWMEQSASQSDVLSDLWLRAFAAAALFVSCKFPLAPLTIRSVENQVGTLLRRGNMWSLAAGLWVAGMTFAACQAAALLVLTRLVPAPAARSSPCSYVDLRHPYYTVAALVATSAVVAQAAATPVRNAVYAHHLGPARPGPLPRRLLLRGVWLAPLAVLLPLQGYWLSWYETVGSFIIPTSSSVFRPRPDLLRDPRWPHYRTDALAGAFGAAAALDVVVYALQTRATRSLVRDLHADPKQTFFTRRLFAGYRYRFAQNVLLMGATAGVFHFYDLL